MKSSYRKFGEFTSLVVVIFLIELAMGIGFLLSYLFFGGDTTSQKYILSAIFQGMAAIFALTLTGVLVISQMLANTYSHRVIKYLFNKWLLFFLIVLYLVSMFYPLMLLNNFSPDSTIDRFKMASAISIALVSVAFSGIFIYFMLISLKSQTVFEFLKKGFKKEKAEIKKMEEFFQVFSDIIIGAIYKYDIETAREGIKALTEIYIEVIFIGESKEIVYEFIEHLRRYERIAKRQENGEVLVEIVKNINKIMLEGYKRGKNPSIPLFFSRIVEEILVYSKNKDDSTFTVCVGEISNVASKAKDIKREVTGKSYYLEHLLSPLCKIEGVLSKETDSPERFSQFKFVTANLYEIGKEYAESGKKDLKEAIIQIVWALEDNLKYLYINKIPFEGFEMNIWYISNIIKTSMNHMVSVDIENMLKEIVPIIDRTSKDEELFVYFDGTLHEFILLLAEFKVKGGELNLLLDEMNVKIKDEKQRTRILTCIYGYLKEQRVFKSDLEKMTHSEKEINAYVEAVKYILDELKKRWGV